MSKADIIRRGRELGVDYALTVSCYQADDEGPRVRPLRLVPAAARRLRRRPACRIRRATAEHAAALILLAARAVARLRAPGFRSIMCAHAAAAARFRGNISRFRRTRAVSSVGRALDF